MGKCTCGTWITGSTRHSSWCDIQSQFNMDVYQKIRYETFQSPYITIAYFSTSLRDPYEVFQHLKQTYDKDILATTEHLGIYSIMWNNGSSTFIGPASEENAQKFGPDITFIEDTWGIDDHIKNVISPHTKRYVAKVNPYTKEIM